MLINAFRQELKDILSGMETDRMPVIRRSLLPDWLYSTDLSAVCRETVKKRFLETLTENGWETMEAGGWIQMRKASHEPPANWHESPFGPKAACCRSLLERHPEGSCSDAEKVQCILIKAAEEGEKAFESACAELHHSWAECLRKGKPLPAVHPAYFSDRRE